jgi:hypothetical protein
MEYVPKPLAKTGRKIHRFGALHDEAKQEGVCPTLPAIKKLYGHTENLKRMAEVIKE